MKQFPTKINGSLETPEEYNDFTTELTNAVEDTNQTMQEVKTHQLSNSMSNYSTMGDFYTCTGTSTAYVLTPVSAQQGTTELFNGARVRFVANVTSGNNPTINVNALGAKLIKKNNGQDNVVNGDIPIGDHIDLVYVLSGTYWLLTTNRSQQTILNNYIDGLKIEQDSGDTDHDIKINIGMCADSNNTTYMKSVTSFIKAIDANWAEGTGVGGFPSGLTLAADTWYYFFLIKKNDGTIDGGFDSSLTAINLLNDASASYEWYRRVGSILTDGSKHIIDFIQTGNYFLWLTPLLDVDVTNPGTVAILHTLPIPLGIKTIAIFNGKINNVGSGTLTFVHFSSPDTTDQVINGNAAPLSNLHSINDKTGNAMLYVLSNISSQIRSRQNVSSVNMKLSISTLGWIDFRGKN